MAFHEADLSTEKSKPQFGLERHPINKEEAIGVVFHCLLLPVPTVDTSFNFTKKSNIAKCFFDICNAEMAQSLSSLQKSDF